MLPNKATQKENNEVIMLTAVPETFLSFVSCSNGTNKGDKLAVADNMQSNKATKITDLMLKIKRKVIVEKIIRVEHAISLKKIIFLV